MVLHCRHWVGVTLAGVAQIAFCDRPAIGALFLLAMATLSPAAALGALAGAALGTAAAYVFHTWSAVEKKAGLPGPNLAIVGIVAGAIIARQGPAAVPMALAAFGACLLLERILRKPLARVGLPLLSLPAVLTGYLASAAYALLGSELWGQGYILIADPLAVLPLILLAGLGMAMQFPRATLQTAVVALAAALITGWIMGTGVFGPVELWAYTVAPAAFGVHAVFLSGSALGACSGLMAAALAAALWAVWQSSPLASAAPPLLLPFILATWATLAWARRRAGGLVLEPAVWAAARTVREARARGKSVVALTGAGASTASGIPDYTSNAWLDPDVPVGAYTWKRYLSSPRCRRVYWDACARFRAVARRARPNAGHRALAALQRQGWIGATVTQNVDGLHQLAGTPRVIELHGTIERIHCLGCGAASPWPEEPSWRRGEVYCPACGELLKPAVTAFGEPLPAGAWDRAQRRISDCGVLLVVGSRMAVWPASELLAQARRAGARVVFVNIGEPAAAVGEADLVLPYPAEAVLPALACLLDCPPSPEAAPPLRGGLWPAGGGVR